MVGFLQTMGIIIIVLSFIIPVFFQSSFSDFDATHAELKLLINETPTAEEIQALQSKNLAKYMWIIILPGVIFGIFWLAMARIIKNLDILVKPLKDSDSIPLERKFKIDH